MDAVFSKRKENKNRRHYDQRVICKALKTIKFFADMQKDDFDFDSFLLQTFDLMEYEEFEKDEAIFHSGDAGDKFYIILKGTVDVFIPKTQDEIVSDSSLESESKRYHLNLNHLKHGHFDSVSSSDSPNNRPSVLQRNSIFSPVKRGIPSNEEVGDEIPRKRGSIMSVVHTHHAKLKIKHSNYTAYSALLNLFSKFPEEKRNIYIDNGCLKFKKARTMEAGSYFGEIALSSNMSRGATVIASSQLTVATLSKSSYKQIFKNVETSLKAKWQFFSELLRGTSREAVTKFCYAFKERAYRFNQKLFEEGEMPRQVFVIHEGEVQV